MMAHVEKKIAIVLITAISMSSLLFCGCSLLDIFKPGSSIRKFSADKVVDLLVKDYDAKEYDDSCNYNSLNHSYIANFEFDDGFYITGNGYYSDHVNLHSFAGNKYVNMFEIRMIEDAIDDTKADYVMYRKGDYDNPDYNVIVVFVEFSDSDDAMDCFNRIMEHEGSDRASTSQSYYGPYFNEKGINSYKKALDQRTETISKYAGTWMDKALSKGASEKVITLDDLDEENYVCTSARAYFDYNLHWDLTVWGDRAIGYLDNPDYLSSPYFVNKDAAQAGVLGHKLIIEDNKLLLIEGYDLSSEGNKGVDRIALIDDLCESFGLSTPFDIDTSYDLEKYLLYVLNYWKPSCTRVNSVY